MPMNYSNVKKYALGAAWKKRILKLPGNLPKSQSRGFGGAFGFPRALVKLDLSRTKHY